MIDDADSELDPEHVDGDPMSGPDEGEPGVEWDEVGGRSPFDPPGGLLKGSPSSALPSNSSPNSVAPVIPLNAKNPGNKFKKGHDPRRGKGGKRNLAKTKLAQELNLPDAVEFKKYADRARSFMRVHRGTLARKVGGGSCGAAPSLFVKFGAMQAAAADWFYEQATIAAGLGLTTKAADFFSRAAKHQAAARQHLAGAHDLAVAERDAAALTGDGNNQATNQKLFAASGESVEGE